MSNQRYLVFLENLTSMDDWEAVRELLPDGHNSSCIVVHTTTLNLAKSCVVAHHQELEPQQFSTDRSVRIFYEYCESMDGNNAEMALKTKAAKQWIHRFKFVGRQEDIWSLAGISRMVQSVYGVDGVGKSYIVKHVYYKQVINPKNFNKFGWVDVLHPFNLRDLSWSLLLDLHSGSLQHTSAAAC